MGKVYLLGYVIPFVLLLKLVYLRYFEPNLGLILWFFHFVYTILWGKLVYIGLHHHFNYSIILEPCCLVSLGIIFGAYSYLFILALLFRTNPMNWWNILSLLSPLGIVLIRLGNIINGEAQGLINYATIDILGSFLMIIFFIISKKIRENSTLFVLFFYSVWKFLVESIRGTNLKILFIYFLPIFFAALFTYVFVNNLVKKNILLNKENITIKDLVYFDLFKK